MEIEKKRKKVIELPQAFENKKIIYTEENFWHDLEHCYKENKSIGSIKPVDFKYFTDLEENNPDKFLIEFRNAFNLEKQRTKIKDKKMTKHVYRLDNYAINAEMFYDEQPYFYDENKIFWMWDWGSCKWKQVDEVELMNRFDKELSFYGDTISSKVKNNYIEAFKRYGRLKRPLDAPKKWVQFGSRAYSLESDEIYHVSPDYFFTNPIPWSLGDSEETPLIDRYLTEWVGDKWKQTMYELISYSCYQGYPLNIMFGLVGTGCNGKSKFQDLLIKFVGIDNMCSTELDVLVDSRFEGAKLFKKLVCSLGETNFTVIKNSSLLKKLSGEDYVGIEIKNKNPFDFKNYAKIIINSNGMPPTDDVSDGMSRRWIIIDFPNQFKEGKDIIPLIPDWEFNNLARKSMRILKELLSRGYFTNQGTIEERRERYQQASDPLIGFIEKECIIGGDYFITYGRMYAAYSKYLNSIKRKGNYKTFNNSLASKGFEISKTSKMIGSEKISTRFIEGMCFKNDIYDVMYPFNNIGQQQKHEKDDRDDRDDHVSNYSFPPIAGVKSRSSQSPESPLPNRGEIDVFENGINIPKKTDLTYATCISCGKKECNWYDSKGRPICNECYHQIYGKKVEW